MQIQPTEIGWEVLGHPHLSLLAQLYVVFLFASLVRAVMHLERSRAEIRRAKQAAHGAAHESLSLLRRRASSIGRWMGVDILLGAAVALSTLINTFDRWQFERAISVRAAGFLFFDALQPTALALWVILVLYLVRWHVLWRIERLAQ